MDGMNECCLTVCPKSNFVSPGRHARVLAPYSQEIVGDECKRVGISVSVAADRLDVAGVNVTNDQLCS